MPIGESGPWSRVYSAFDTLKELRATILTLVFLLLGSAICYSLYYSQSLRSSTDITSDLMVAASHVPHKGDEKALRDSLNNVLISESSHHFWQEFFLHLAVSLLVAFTVIVSVEVYASARKRAEVREHEKNLAISIWKTIFERFIPEGVVRELEGIVKTDAIKESCSYTLTFSRPYSNLPQDCVILRRAVRFKIRNIRNKLIEFPLRSFITDEQEDFVAYDREGRASTVPRHIEALVNDVRLPMDEVVKANERGQKRNLEYDITIGRDQEPVDVYMSAEEMVPLRGLNAYMQLTPIHDLSVEVRNNCEDYVRILGVQFNHPNFAGFKKRPEGLYEYKGGVLPGQGFLVTWTVATAPPSGEEGAEST
jgi:hypothetical protein